LSRIIRPARFCPETVVVKAAGPQERHGCAEGLNQESQPSEEMERLIQMRVREIEERFEAERETVYRSGLETGKALAEERIRGAVNDFISLVEDVNEQRLALFKEAQEVVLRLAMALARKIIGYETSHNVEPVLRTVRESIKHLVDKSHITVKVNPEDLQIVRRHRQDWLALADGNEGLKIEGDPSISRGGCIIETDSGRVDARIERQLEIMYASLMGVLDEQGDGGLQKVPEGH